MLIKGGYYKKLPIYELNEWLPTTVIIKTGTFTYTKKYINNLGLL